MMIARRDMFDLPPLLADLMVEPQVRSLFLRKGEVD
jgi:hypothetical protein